MLTPDVAFTCTNTSQAGGSLIDFAVASGDLAPKLTLRPILHYGFKPHVVSIRVHIAAGFEPDIGRRLVVPHEICEHAGPREFDDTWAKHWNLADAIKPKLGVPWDTSASWEATKLYSQFSWAAESYFMATNPAATDKQHGRASKLNLLRRRSRSGTI